MRPQQTDPSPSDEAELDIHARGSIQEVPTTLNVLKCVPRSTGAHEKNHVAGDIRRSTRGTVA